MPGRRTAQQTDNTLKRPILQNSHSLTTLSNPIAATPGRSNVLALQSAIGNQAVQRLLTSQSSPPSGGLRLTTGGASVGLIQRKLDIDAFRQKAREVHTGEGCCGSEYDENKSTFLTQLIGRMQTYNNSKRPRSTKNIRQAIENYPDQNKVERHKLIVKWLKKRLNEEDLKEQEWIEKEEKKRRKEEKERKKVDRTLREQFNTMVEQYWRDQEEVAGSIENPRELPSKEKKALSGYLQSECYEMNDAMRGIDKDRKPAYLTEEKLEKIGHAMSGLQKLPSYSHKKWSIGVKRGSDVLLGGVTDESELEEGKVYRDPGFLSTARDSDGMFHGKKFNIKITKFKSGKWMYELAKTLGEAQDKEDEVLFPPMTPFVYMGKKSGWHEYEEEGA